MVSLVPPQSVQHLRNLIEEAIAENPQLVLAYKNLHQGYPDDNIRRFLKAKENDISKAFNMLLDSLNWRVNNDIDTILSKPIGPKDAYHAIRKSHLVGMSGFCKQGRPVFALGVSLGGFDKAPVNEYVHSHIQINEYRDRVLLPEASKQNGRFIGTCLKVLDLTNLKLSSLNRLKILTTLATVDELNYPEKTDVYYIVNAPYTFSACWKVIRPLLQERTRQKVQVLQGSGKEELLKVMDYNVLPHFCKSTLMQRSSSLRGGVPLDCYSPSHPFHMEVSNYIKKNSMPKCVGRVPQTSCHVQAPETARNITVIESALMQIAQTGYTLGT